MTDLTDQDALKAELWKQHIEITRLTAELDFAEQQAAKNADEVVALREEVAGLREDAQRYRWLRSQELDDPEIWIAVDSAKIPGRWALGGDDPRGCDAAIDAARKAAP